MCAAWRDAGRSARTDSIRSPGSTGMERRVLLAVVLSFIILYVFQALFPPPPPAVGTGQSEPQPKTSSSAQVPASGRAAEAAPPALSVELVVSDEVEREIVVETQTVEAVLTNRGGRVLRWRLKDYFDRGGSPVDLVPTDVPPDWPRPFSLELDDPEATARLNSALYRVSGAEGSHVEAAGRPVTITFDYEDASGLKAKKEFRFAPQSYVVVFSAEVVQDGKPAVPAVAWGPGLGDRESAAGGGSFFTGNYVQRPQAILGQGRDVERVGASALLEQPTREGQFSFAGIDDHFFLAAVVGGGPLRVDYRPVTLPGAAPDEQRELVAQTFRFAEGPHEVQFFVGPKQFDVLQAVDVDLVRAIHYGVFSIIIVPMLSTLKWLYGMTGNYGWSIVLLTVIINLAMFPLRHKSVVAMRKMQAIQPQMKAIQERYAHLKVSDPQRQKMNTEIMNLYREKGVNPASGCVPMLITMPVLIAFYSLLSMSIELRGAPFVGWISDLSVADPFYVLPALMGITMFWQQKITPTTADPTQQKVMMIMPVLFTGMMAFAPSGVVLYWFVSQVWAIGQQYFTNWLIGPPEGVLAQPPAARKVKPAGAGRSAAAERRS